MQLPHSEPPNRNHYLSVKQKFYPERQAILKFFRHADRQSFHLTELCDRLRVPRNKKRTFLAQLDELVAEGSLLQLRGQRYALPRASDLVRGRVTLHRDGYGFVMPDKEGALDIYIASRDLGGAMQDDLVEVAVRRGPQRGDRRQGRVVKILEHATAEILGIYRQGRHAGRIHAVGKNRGLIVEVPFAENGGACPGEAVLAHIEHYPTAERPARARVAEVFGQPDDPAVEVRMTAHRFGLPQEFSPAAAHQAEQVSDRIDPAELEGRKDLRQLPFVTIDGETAKDFDDAVALQPEGKAYRLWVAIADVAHYVRPGSPLDRDALERGTSVYFPGVCLPMFPERLSNGICSLNPAEDRLVMVAEMLFSATGELSSSEFYPAVMHSRARLTYTLVQQFLDGGESPQVDEPRVLQQLMPMAKLTRLLMARRKRRGSLDFELPEAEIQLDENGGVVGIRKAPRLFAHRLIEEFMLAANEAVADFLERQGQPLLFRVHEPPAPEKLEAFQQFVAHFNRGLILSPPADVAGALQRLLAEVAGAPEEQAINQVLLRSMRQAHYSAENVGHFGLAATSYCHFTSPIRRYPDLQVHRALKHLLVAGSPVAFPGLEELGEDLSLKERRAMEAERDLVALKKCRFMQGRIGESFPGRVSGVQAFGMFVELEDIFVEGLVHVTALQDDYYHFEEDLQRLVGYNRRRIFQIGDSVQVRLVRVDLDGREIDFELDEASTSQPRSRRMRRNRK